MKILELRLLNLNSLYGEWHIDFTDPEYAANGIFALTGPTGAGKSSILDAICLALYGATPRLGKITKSSNEIMSRQTGECFAEIVFESQSGSYRCKWAQRKARKSSDGNLQIPEHEISDSKTGVLIETKKRSVLEVIEEKTGMDFDRFTRSILLAQGGFDTFLKADIEQKSKILEQITGTEIYSEISRRVHERHRAERERLNLLQFETVGITIIDANLEEQMRQDLGIHQSQAAELDTNLTNTKIAIDWVNAINLLKNEIQTIHAEEELLKLEIEAFKPQQEKLKLSQKAARLDGEYATLTALRKQQIAELEAVKEQERKLPEMEISANNQFSSLQSAEQSTLLAKEELNSTAPLIQKIRSIDQTIEGKNKIILDITESCNRDIATIQQNERSQLIAHSRRLEAEKSLEISKKYLNDNIHDEWLISNLAGVEVKLKNLLAKQKEISQKEYDLKSAEASLADATKQLETVVGQCASSRNEFAQAQTDTQQLKDVLIGLTGGKPLREFRVEKESLQKEKEYFLRIAALDVHREKLEDGQPCPLCGSIDHPFAEGIMPLPDEVDQKIELISSIIKKAEDQEVAIQQQEIVLNAIRDSLSNFEKSEAIAINYRVTAELKVADTKYSLTQHQEDFDSLKREIGEKLQPLGIIEMPESFSALFESLKRRLANWQEQCQKRTEAEKQILTIDSDINSLKAVIESQANTLNEKQKNLEKLQVEYSTLISEREKLYGNKNPNEEELRLKNSIVMAEKIEKNVRNAYSDLQQSLTVIKLLIHSKRLGVTERSPILETAEESFASLLSMESFENEDQYLVAKITIEEQNVISLQSSKLHDSSIQLKSKREDREARLSAETGKNISEKTSNELEVDFKNIELALNELRTTIQYIQQKLNENTAAKNRLIEKQALIQAQQKECEHWEKLHSLIGSADGKKFRNFAQGLTFELLISHANRYLEKMTDRYLLIRDQHVPLELNVADNYQTGEVRPTKNLSGGECFIVSLTLALGLSRMSSRKVRVDSLFLDEGFGSLDEDTLETALDVLSGLHHQGKLICVISHVPALNERISCQLKVSPGYGGKSIITGPGCRQVSAISNT